LTTEYRSRIDTESADLPTSPQVVRDKRFRKYAPNVEHDAGQERAGVETENAKTIVKISVNVRACGATLLIFKKSFGNEFRFTPLFFFVYMGDK
jgi:hypothetical protein